MIRTPCDDLFISLEISDVSRSRATAVALEIHARLFARSKMVPGASLGSNGNFRFGSGLKGMERLDKISALR